MTIPQIYELAEQRMSELIRKLGTANPAYQKELMRLANEITRDLALQRP